MRSLYPFLGLVLVALSGCPTELCNNLYDDDGDGLIDEDCTPCVETAGLALTSSAPSGAQMMGAGAFQSGSALATKKIAFGADIAKHLRSRQSARIDKFPLGGERVGQLDLHRFEPFAPGARAQVMRADGVHEVPLPDEVYFSGEVRGEPGSMALLIATPDSVHGFVAAEGTVYSFAPNSDGALEHRSFPLTDAATSSTSLCGNSLHPDLALPTTAKSEMEPSFLLPNQVVEARVAIETDQELRSKFSSDSATLSYLASLAAASSAIYDRDAKVRLNFSYIRLWSTTDPWVGANIRDQLDEVQAHWRNPANGLTNVPRDMVHFISGRGPSGGIAYINATCNDNYGYGVSQVYGSFNVATPSQIWDVLVVSHELGHTLGSQHSHCYTPPVDMCFNGEEGCYSGPVVASRGTVMSYCHMLGGVSNVDLFLGTVVSNQIRASGAQCLQPVAVCGNGTVEGGEQCDDGNTRAGDGCNSSCYREGCITCGGYGEEYCPPPYPACHAGLIRYLGVCI